MSPMPATSGWQPFSIEDGWVHPFVAGVPGTGFDMPGMVSVEGDPQTTVIEHRGDGTVIAKGRTIDSIDLTIVIANWDFVAISKLVGGTINATTGVTTNQIQAFDQKTTDAPADMGIKVQTRSRSPDGGALRIVYPRVQPLGLPAYGLTDQEFQDLSVPMTAIAETSFSKIVTLEHWETYTALTSTWANP
jgi:hypothetical protein